MDRWTNKRKVLFARVSGLLLVAAGALGSLGVWLPLHSQSPQDATWTGQPSQACLHCHEGIEAMHSLDRPTDMFVPPNAGERGLDRQGLTGAD
jgi:hypothetical protein